MARRRKWLGGQWALVGGTASPRQAPALVPTLPVPSTAARAPAIQASGKVATTTGQAAASAVPLPVLRTGRSTFENPDQAVTFATIIPPSDFETQWRTLQLESATLDKLPATTILGIMVDLSPEMSKGLWDFLRFCNAGYSFVATDIMTGEPYPEAQAAMQAWLDMLRFHYGSTSVQINALFAGAWLRGGFFAELVLDSTGAIDLAAPDPFTARFIPFADPKRGQTWKLGQSVRGQFVDMSDLATVRYVPVDRLPGSPYGRPLCAPALFACLFLLAVLRDLRKVIQQHGYAIRDVEVLTEVLRQEMPDAVAADPTKIKAWYDTILQGIADYLTALNPDDAFVHLDSVKSHINPGTTEGMVGMVNLLDWIDRMAIRALKTMPMLMGVTDGVSEANANRQWEMHIAGIKAMQHLLEDVFSHFGKLVCQAAGLQANVEWRFAEVRGSEELRDELVREKRGANSLFEELVGYESHDAAAVKAVGHAPALPAPSLVPKMWVKPGAGGKDTASSSGGDAPAAGGDVTPTNTPSKGAGKKSADGEGEIDQALVVRVLDALQRVRSDLAVTATNGNH